MPPLSFLSLSLLGFSSYNLLRAEVWWMRSAGLQVPGPRDGNLGVIVKPLVEGWLAWSQGCILARLRLGFVDFSTFFLESGESLVILRLLGFLPLI